MHASKVASSSLLSIVSPAAGAAIVYNFEILGCKAAGEIAHSEQPTLIFSGSHFGHSDLSVSAADVHS